MPIPKAMQTSDTCEWYTPLNFFNKLDEEFRFNLDVCATKENACCPRFYTKEDNGLEQEWSGVIWCNPPYGLGITPWIKKAYEYGEKGGLAVLLVPSKTDTIWWHEYCMKASEIRFVKGRLTFGGAKWPAPFPSSVCIFKPHKNLMPLLNIIERE